MGLFELGKRSRSAPRRSLSSNDDLNLECLAHSWIREWASASSISASSIGRVDPPPSWTSRRPSPPEPARLTRVSSRTREHLTQLEFFAALAAFLLGNLILASSVRLHRMSRANHLSDPLQWRPWPATLNFAVLCDWSSSRGHALLIGPDRSLTSEASVPRHSFARSQKRPSSRAVATPRSPKEMLPSWIILRRCGGDRVGDRNTRPTAGGQPHLFWRGTSNSMQPEDPGQRW